MSTSLLERIAHLTVQLVLMTGTNNNMTRLITVASGLDGTDGSLSPFNWTCPAVQPYSAIYFYQVGSAL